MLSGEPTRRATAATVRPDYLIQEVLLPEHLVEHEANMVRAAPVEVYVEAAGGLEQAVHLLEPLPKKIEIAGQTAPVSIVECHRRAGARAHRALGVEGRISVDKVATAGREGLHHLEIVGTDHATWLKTCGKPRRPLLSSPAPGVQ